MKPSPSPAAPRLPLLLLLCLLVCAAPGRAMPSAATPSPAAPPRAGRRACKAQPALICNLAPTANNTAAGPVLFTPAFRAGRCLVRIRARLAGLPGRRHALHIHTYGDVSDASGASTGGHFTNPAGDAIAHGLPGDAVRHWGDFGNVRARAGVARYSRFDALISLPGIVGRGMTLHALPDQGAAAQPTGGAGARIGFCVIGFANPASLTR